MTAAGAPRSGWSTTGGVTAIVLIAAAIVVGLRGPALPWALLLVVVGWSLHRWLALAVWATWAVALLFADGLSGSVGLELVVVAGVSAAVHLLVASMPRPMTRLRQAWFVLGALLALAVLSALLLGSSTSPGETPRAVVGAFALLSTGAAVTWWQESGRPRAVLCAPLALAAITAFVMLGTAEVLRYRDIDALEADAERISAAFVASHADTMQVIVAETTSATEVPLDVDAFTDRMRPVLAGHEAIASVVLVEISDDGTTQVLASADTVGGARAEVLSAWLESEHDNSGDHHSLPGVADYIEMVQLPGDDGASVTHLVHAATVTTAGDVAADRVLYAALSVPSLLRSASEPTLAGSGGASVVLLDGSPAVGRGITADRRIAALDAVDDLGALVEVPTDDPEMFGDAPVDLHGSTFTVVVRPSVGYGLAHSTLQMLLLSLAFIGLIGFATLAQRRINVAAADEAQGRRQALLDAALAGSRGWSAVVGADDRIRIANDDPLGTSEGHQLGEAAVLVGDELGLARARGLLRQARAAGSARVTHVGSDADGRARIVEMSANVLPATGEEQLCFLQFIDVTDDRELSMRVAQADRMEAIGALAGGVAHDFNNLLFITLGYLQLIEQHADRNDDAKLASYVAPAIDAVRRGADVTKALLTVSGQHPMNEQAVDVAAFMDELAPLVRQAVGKGVAIQLHAEPDVRVQVDAGRLSGSVLNLCANARHALAGRPSPRVDLVARRVSDREVVIEVTDNGIGMSPEVAARAFEPFFTTRGRANGTGLGLASVFAFAQQSGGSAAIASQEGVGTTVSITLPLAGAGIGTQTERSGRGGAERVLVLDDERDIADLVASWLEPFVDEVRTAQSPHVALDLDESFEPQVLVCDAHLASEIDGLEVARRVLARRPDTTVIFMTGFADCVRELEAMGAVTLAKPFSRDDFLDEMRRRGVVAASGTGTVDAR